MNLFRVQFVAAAAAGMLLAILGFSSPSHSAGSDLTCSESDVRRRSANTVISTDQVRALQRLCQQRKAGLQLEADYKSRRVEIAKTGLHIVRRLNLQLEEALAEDTAQNNEKWSLLRDERKKQFDRDTENISEQVRSAAKDRDDARRVGLEQERRQIAQDWRDDSSELRRGRDQENSATRAATSQCYNGQILESRNTTNSLLGQVDSRNEETKRALDAVPVDYFDPEPKDKSAAIYGGIVDGVAGSLGELLVCSRVPMLPVALACGAVVTVLGRGLGKAFEEAVESSPPVYEAKPELSEPVTPISEETMQQIEEFQSKPIVYGSVYNPLAFLDEDPCNGDPEVSLTP